MGRRRWAGYVALGDAVTEGGRNSGLSAQQSWAGRLAAILDGNARLEGRRVSFRNFGATGQRVRDVTDRQLPRAIAEHPDLVSIMAGGPELQSSRHDPDNLAAKLEAAVATLRASGIDVLIANAVDPQFASFMRPTRNRVAAFNANVWSIARTHGAYTLDVWGIRELQGHRMWTADRAQLTPAGHRLVANRAAHSLGVPYFDLGIESAAPVLHSPAVGLPISGYGTTPGGAPRV